MPKHLLLSPVPSPPPKRLHTLTNKRHCAECRAGTTFDALSDEIILIIFSYLFWTDLCVIQSTSRNWSRLCLDNQLWKRLYTNEYGRERLRGIRGFIGRHDGREVKPLPGRAKFVGLKDWKWMFRISSNWQSGRCSVETLDGSVPPLQSHASEVGDIHMLLAGNVVVLASSLPSSAPTILLSSPPHPLHTLLCTSSRPHCTTHITALALDQSPPLSCHHGRLVCFLSTGEFILFTIDHQTPSCSVRLFTYVPSGRSARTCPITQAVYHHPLLVTLSQSFQLSLYDLSSDAVNHSQTLTSFTSYPPSSLVLSTPSSTTYKLILAYAIPVYPAHWTVGATELIISHSGSERMRATSTRTTRAMEVPPGWVDEHKMRAVREQWGRKVACVADTQTDGKWVVLAPGQHVPRPAPAPPSSGRPSSPHIPAHAGSGSGSGADSSRSSDWAASPPASPGRTDVYASSSLHSACGLQLYRLHLPASPSTSAPKLTFVRTLHGQIGPVSTLALADGRCVSLGVNGSIWVWDLEAGTGTKVSGGVRDVAGEDAGDAGDRASAEAWEAAKSRLASGARGAVVFDERRIVSSSGSSVEGRRFDI